MNRFAYQTTGLAIKTLSSVLKAQVRIHNKENVPDGSIIFVINHFTRIETMFIPSYIYDIARVPVWSLADYKLFKGPLGSYLNRVGALSTKNPDRDLLIVKSLLTGEAVWIIFPEGRMVKNKKIIEKGQFMISYAGGKHPPHTGAATLAIRTEFYRQRLKHMLDKDPDEANRLMKLFQINSAEPVVQKTTYIVPVNLTYYPIRARENILSNLASKYVEDIPKRMMEEIMTEGTMLLSGVDIDMRFGRPIRIKDFMSSVIIKKDITASKKINFDDPIPSRRVMRYTALDIMDRYMSAIYRMTTLNHDHLFASVLKLIPFKKINERNLRQRVFLATTFDLENMGVRHHKSLEADQVHLLTDDRYSKFREFIALAIEKGVLSKKGNTLVKDMSRFSSPFDFHHVRIDNPISVMANEVEPLLLLQRKLNNLVWLPCFWIRHRIKKRLFKRAISEYEEDYKEFYVKGESKKKQIGMPLLVRGKTKKIGVLLIHGYMSVPLQMGELASYLADRGVWVYAVRLKGHGTSPDDLAVRTYTDWIDSVNKGYALISSICDHIIVGGFSTGAALALNLASKVDDIEGVIAACTPLSLQDISSKFASAVDKWNRLMKKTNIDKAKKEFVKNNPETPHLNYFRNPISGVREIEAFMDALEPRLSSIEIPALIVQSNNDPVVNPKGSKRIFRLLGSEDKKYVLFNLDRHCIVLGRGADQVHREIWHFVEHIQSQKT
ncbi:MAG: alpha/beta fold hydrolase [Desulfobacterales bacterium]|nr:alpha/beta fold hydrolase [Desulfobacterales bacterium]